jgi:hypothetical protein
MDLYVTNPDGKTCGYKFRGPDRRSCTGSNMQLYWDFTRGNTAPEIVLAPVAKPGRWIVSWHMFKGSADNVHGEVVSNRKTITIPPRRVTSGEYSSPRAVLTFTVEESGDITGVSLR